MHSSSQESRLFNPSNTNRSPLRGSSFNRENRVSRRRSMERAAESNTKAENYYRARITGRAGSRDKNDSVFEEEFSEKRKGYNRGREEEDDFSWIEERERMSTNGNSGNNTNGGALDRAGNNTNGNSGSNSRYSWYSHGENSRNSSKSPSRRSYGGRGSRSVSPHNRSVSRERYGHRDTDFRDPQMRRGSHYDRNSSRSASPNGRSQDRNGSRSASRDRYEHRGMVPGHMRRGYYHDRNSSRSASPNGRSQERSSQVSWRPIRSSNAANNCRHESQEYSPCAQNRHHHVEGCGCYRCKAHAHNEKLVHTYKDHTSVTTPCGTEHVLYTKKDVYAAQHHARADSKIDDIELHEALTEYNVWAVKNNAPELTMEDVLRTKRESMEHVSLPRRGANMNGRGRYGQ